MMPDKIVRAARKILFEKQRESRERFRDFTRRIEAQEKARVKYILWKMGVRRPSSDQVRTVARVLWLSLKFDEKKRSRP